MKVFTVCAGFLAPPEDHVSDGDFQAPPVPDAEQPHGGRIRPPTLVAYAALLGLAMIAAAWLWAGVIRGRHLGAWFPTAHWCADLILGGLVGTGFALAAWALLDTHPAFQRIEEMLLAVLDMDALRWYHAPLFGLLAGIPEEVLFRGAMQAVLGWPLTSILFGALHALTPAYFVYATVAGALLGGLAIWRGGLWAPVAAHIAIDTIMFALLIHRWRRASRAA
jgi:membrane protease YdiL (CAAX protease family)